MGVLDPDSPTVQYESRDVFWVSGFEDFVWIFPPPPGYTQSFLTSYEVRVEYDGDHRVVRVQVGPVGRVPQPPPKEAKAAATTKPLTIRR